MLRWIWKPINKITYYKMIGHQMNNKDLIYNNKNRIM